MTVQGNRTRQFRFHLRRTTHELSESGEHSLVPAADDSESDHVALTAPDSFEPDD